MSNDTKKPDLPFKIDRVKVQIRNKNRVNIYENDVFKLGLSRSTFEKENLQTGDIITEEIYKRLFRSEDESVVRDYLLGLLSRRAHASFELVQKANKKGYDSELVEEIIAQLQDKGWVNDQEFAISFAASKCRMKWGPEKIRMALYQKKIKGNLIEKALDEFFSETDIKTLMENALRKKRNALLREKDSGKRKQKLYLFLQSKGFHSSDISQHISELMQDL